MKRIAYLSLILFVSACGTSQKNSSESSKKNSEVAVETKKAVAAKPVVQAPVQKVEEQPAVVPAPVPQDELGNALKSSQEDRIRRAATDILLKNPQDVRALNSLAMTHYKNSQFTAALYLLNKAAKINDHAPEIHNNMGVVYMAQGELHSAIKAFRKTLEVDPGNAFAAANLGQIYTANKDYGKAVSAYEIATSRGIRDWKTMNNYAVALTATKNYDRADDIYKDLLKTQTSQKEVLFNYSILLIERMGKYDKGLEIVHRLQLVGPPGDARKKVAELEAKAKTGVGK